MNTVELLAEIGRRIASYYALLADGDNTERTQVKLYAKIDVLLELLNEFHIEYEFIGNNEGTEKVNWYDFEGIIINNRSYTYTIKDQATWSFCINEQNHIDKVESEIEI